MLICGMDLETTGLDVEQDEITEIGAVLWDTEKKEPVSLLNLLVKPKTKPITPEITKLTGITNDMVSRYGHTSDAALLFFAEFAGQADVMVAHNGSMFDKPLLLSSYKRSALGPEVTNVLQEWQWLDTSVDVPYPDSIKTRKLVHLAAEHNFLNPFAHRAVFDVLTMLKVLSQYDFAEVLALSKEPSIVLQAMCEKPWEDEGKSTDEAKGSGYRWDGKSKKWLKTVKQRFLEKEMQQAKLYRVVVNE